MLSIFTRRFLWSKFKEGPAGRTPGEVFVIVTHFQAERLLDLPGITRGSYSLRQRWPELPGAVGVWTWLDWRNKRVGSVSIWKREQDMRAFLRWEPHVKIIRRYRRAGVTTSVSWTSETFDRRATHARAVQELSNWKATG